MVAVWMISRNKGRNLSFQDLFRRPQVMEITDKNSFMNVRRRELESIGGTQESTPTASTTTISHDSQVGLFIEQHHD